MTQKQLPNAKNNSGKLSEAIFKTLEKIVNTATLTFTIICLVVCTIGVLSKSKQGLGISSAVVLWIGLFCLLVGIVNAIVGFMKTKNVNAVIVWATHLVLNYASFYAIFIAGDIFNTYITGSAATQGNGWFRAFVLTFLFIGIYAVVMAIRFAVFAAASKLKNRSSEYESIYTDCQEK